MIDVSEDSYPDYSKIKASWAETERVLEMLRQHEGLMSRLNDPRVCGIAPLQPNAFTRQRERLKILFNVRPAAHPYRSFDLCVMQNADMAPRAYIFRPNTAVNPIYFPRQFESDLALKILEIVARYGKTSAARRELPLTSRVRALLEARWENAGRPDEGWIWPAPTKTGHIDHSTVKKQHRNALRLSGVRPFVLYSLRHSFATRVAPHVDAWTLCKIMGWSSLSVAMTYIHPSEDRVLDAFSTMSGHKSGHSPERPMLTASNEYVEIAEELRS